MCDEYEDKKVTLGQCLGLPIGGHIPIVIFLSASEYNARVAD